MAKTVRGENKANPSRHYNRRTPGTGVDRRATEEQNLMFFNGALCSNDPSHGTIRYTNNGTCMVCNKQQSAVAKEKFSRKACNAAAARKRTLAHGDLKSNPLNYRHQVFVLGSVQSVEIWEGNLWKFQ